VTALIPFIEAPPRPQRCRPDFGAELRVLLSAVVLVFLSRSMTARQLSSSSLKQSMPITGRQRPRCHHGQSETGDRKYTNSTSTTYNAV